MEFSKELWGLISLALTVVSYGPYLWGTIKGTVRPHIFSWIIWATLMAIGAAAQWSDNAGPGAWSVAASAVFCLMISVASFINKGERYITRSDWLSFVSSLATIPLWIATDNPLYSVILITLIDALGYYPTFRKGYFHPNDENLLPYAMGIPKHIFGLIALLNVSWITFLYPASLVFMNTCFITMLLWRRKALAS